MSDAPQTRPSKPQRLDPRDAQLEMAEMPKYLLAKTFFDCREYDRCAAVFLPGPLPKPAAPSESPQLSKQSPAKGKGKASTGSMAPPSSTPLRNISQRSLFLALYARYISGEKNKDEESEMILGPADGGVTMNKELTGLTAILEQWFQEQHARGGTNGGWLEYLYGIVLAKGKNEDLAKQWLIRSVNIYPWNWGAWQELANLLGTVEEVSTGVNALSWTTLMIRQLHLITEQLPQNIMTFMFHVYINQELFQSTEQIHNELAHLLNIFPNSAFLKSQRALLFYHSKGESYKFHLKFLQLTLSDFEEAEQIFSSLVASEPHRLDSLDNYSNILYVMSSRPRLAHLAQTATATDKFRPETCCIVGNYYSLCSEHEKAVIYFRRALTLDRTFLSAWTLMGHEYVEMKNTHAAIESYRRAVDVNRKDYRAWYGLGQTYEMLEMHSYALFYFHRAASLRPYDPKMWQAVAACFAKVGKLQNGIRAYKRALVAGSYYDGGAGVSGASFGSSQDSSGGGVGGLAGGVLDPEVLYAIALLYERLGEPEECAAYMELTLLQEEGAQPDDNDEDGGAGMGVPLGGSAGGGPERGGVGVTPTTSKARMWLARWEFMRGNWQRSMELANELCQDGVEVEDAKALVRDIRSKVEAEREEAAAATTSGGGRRS